MDLKCILKKRKVLNFKSAILYQLIGPCVYMMYQNDACLYIGMSQDGLYRCLSYNHKHRDLLKFKAVDCLKIIPCESVGEAEALEAELIREIQPTFNDYFNQRTAQAKPKNFTDKLMSDLSIKRGKRHGISCKQPLSR